MATRITVLDVVKSGDGSFTVAAAFWLQAPAGRIIARPNATSRVPNATTAEVDAIRSGTVVEVIHKSGLLPAGTSAAQVRAGMEALLAREQARLNATATAANYIGAVFDDVTGWTLP